ncbi:MAG: aminotransferase class IV [Saprospiraceae bacterium]|nr:aminotransferase class IV [Saprospiraceae bacterium]
MKEVKYCYVNGELSLVATATIGINDLALLRGYGVFDFLAVRQGAPLFLDDYLARFERSAGVLGLQLPFSSGAIREMVWSLVRINGLDQAGIRLVLTGGYSEDGYAPAVPNLVILEHDLPPRNEQLWNQGIKMISYAHQRELPEAKSINYLTGIRLLDLLKKEGATEALFHDNGWVRESARANFFIVSEQGRLVTPEKKILHGITRQRILQSAGHFIEVEVREVALEEVFAAREAFITSTTKGNLPVVQVDDHLIGDGKPGPVSRAISTLLENQIAAHISQTVQAQV